MKIEIIYIIMVVTLTVYTISSTSYQANTMSGVIVVILIILMNRRKSNDNRETQSEAE